MQPPLLLSGLRGIGPMPTNTNKMAKKFFNILNLIPFLAFDQNISWAKDVFCCCCCCCCSNFTSCLLVSVCQSYLNDNAFQIQIWCRSNDSFQSLEYKQRGAILLLYFTRKTNTISLTYSTLYFYSIEIVEYTQHHQNIPGDI